MQCEVRSYLVAVQIAQLTQSEPVPVRDLRSVRLAGDLRHRSFDDSSARVDVVHDVERRSLIAESCKSLDQAEHVLGVIEVARSRILDFDDNGIESPDIVF